MRTYHLRARAVEDHDGIYTVAAQRQAGLIADCENRGWTISKQVMPHGNLDSRRAFENHAFAALPIGQRCRYRWQERVILRKSANVVR
jgi:hypothetical protein